MARTTTRTDGAGRARAIAWRRRASTPRICDVIEPPSTARPCAARAADLLELQQPARRGPGHRRERRRARPRRRRPAGRPRATGRSRSRTRRPASACGPGFEALGWAAERLAWLLLDGPPPPGPDFDEVPFARHARRCASSGRAGRRGRPTRRPARRFTEHEDRSRGAARHARAAGPRRAGDAGRLRELRRDGDTAEIEQVYVTAAQRGRGTGGALVAAATARPPARRNVHRRRRRGRLEAPLRAARLRAGLDPARLHAEARLSLRERARPVERRPRRLAEAPRGDELRVLERVRRRSGASCGEAGVRRCPGRRARRARRS